MESMPRPPITKEYGKRVFIGSCIFAALTIVGVMYDERRQRLRRQEGVKLRMLSLQHEINMKEYEAQKVKFNEYKEANC